MTDVLRSHVMNRSVPVSLYNGADELLHAARLMEGLYDRLPDEDDGCGDGDGGAWDVSPYRMCRSPAASRPARQPASS